MQSDCKNTGVFEDSRFVMLIAFAQHPITRRLQKNFQNPSFISPKTTPKGASNSDASWNCFRDGFGPILDSQMGSSSGALRPSRGLQKRQLFILVSLEASRNDFGRLLDLLGLDFGLFLDTMFASKLSAKRVCHWSCAVHLSYLPSPERSTVAEVAKH